MEQNISKVLDIKETVEYFGGHISEWMIRQLVNAGEIPHFRQGNKKLLFDSEELEQWWKGKVRDSLKPKEKPNEYGALRKITI